MKFLKAALIFTLAMSAYAQGANQASGDSEVANVSEAPVVASKTDAPEAPVASTVPEAPATQETPATPAAPAAPATQEAPAAPAAPATQETSAAPAAPATQEAPAVPANQDNSSPNKAQVIYSCVKPNTIAFTIDDGPTEHTPELLKALKEAGIVATFYVNAANVLKDPEGKPLDSVVPFIKDIYEAGHEIGSHTYNHACRTQTCKLNNPQSKIMDTKEAFTEQIVNNENVIFEAIGKYPATYRAPYGDGQNPGQVDETMLEWLKELGYPYAIHWDIETQDMEYSNQSIDIAFKQAQDHYNSETAQKDKLITLQHAIPVTIEKIIPWIKNEWMPKHPNMQFVKVSECLGLTDKDVYRTETSDAKMIKASYALLISAIVTILYLI